MLYKRMRTYHTPPDLSEGLQSTLCFYVGQYGTGERALFASFQANDDIETLKRIFQKRLAIGARRFNAVHADRKGSIDAIAKRRPELIDESYLPLR